MCQQLSTSIRPCGDRTCHACTHLGTTRLVALTQKACSQTKRSDAARVCHHCCHCVVAACANAAPKEWVALQPFERFEPDQNSALQHTRGQCPLMVGIRVRGRAARGASLRSRFAHFCGKANHSRAQCLSGAATRPLRAGESREYCPTASRVSRAFRVWL